MLAEDNLLYRTIKNKSFNKINEGHTDTFFNNNKLYDINDDEFDINSKNSGLSLNSLIKYKTFKEYKESLEKKITLSNQNNIERKKNFYDEKFGSNKISEFSIKNSNRKFESLDKKYIISRKKLLKDLQSPKEKSTIDKHRSFQKLHISNYGYPNIKKFSRSNNLSVPTSKMTFTEKNILINDDNDSNDINSRKKEAFSIDKRMDFLDKNENNNTFKRLENITNNSLKKNSLSFGNDNKLEKVKTPNITGTYNINSLKNINENIAINPEEVTKTKRGKIIWYENEKNLNKIDKYDKLNTKKSIDDEENKNSLKIIENEIIQKNDENDEEEKIISKFLNNKKSNPIKSFNINSEGLLYSNKMKKKYDNIYMEKKEDINELLNNPKENSNLTTNCSNNLIEKSKQIKEKRKNEKMKIIEDLNEMKKAQEERYQMIEKESSEWKKTVSDIEKSMDSLKSIINNTDGIFSNLFKKGKELELEVNALKKKKNKDCEKTYYGHIDNEDIEDFNTDKENLALHGENIIFPIVDDNNLISIL
ncbi:hypothetical protein H8356DRAFT_1682649 [Neocallimastix lanati (nom. inval.)]|nr:hypothetical protein H8356DRAFT_1682649 [Neocallimastix sp. JGI-2020a]